MRYTPFSYRSRYGIRLQRLTVDGGFSCPNRDGTVGTGGCTFCDNAAFHPAYTRGKSIPEQVAAGIAFHKARGRKADGYLAYFQAYSNTHAPLDVLRARYGEALACPGVRGLVIGTRPDCVDGDKLDYLASLRAEGYIVEVEFGIESVYDQTLRRVNRGHDFACTRKAVAATAERGIPVGGHLIVGLPGEGPEEIEHTMQCIEELDPDDVTVHALALKRAARLALHMDEYEKISFRASDMIMERCQEGCSRLGMTPYYLYRQKNMAGNFENVGYAKSGKAGLYNILIMEEVECILALGASGSTKIVYDDGRIERIENVKDIRNYLERIDEMIRRKDVLTRV